MQMMVLEAFGGTLKPETRKLICIETNYRDWIAKASSSDTRMVEIENLGQLKMSLIRGP